MLAKLGYLTYPIIKGEVEEPQQVLGSDEDGRMKVSLADLFWQIWKEKGYSLPSNTLRYEILIFGMKKLLILRPKKIKELYLQYGNSASSVCRTRTCNLLLSGVNVDFTTIRFVVSYPADDIYLIAARDLVSLSEMDVGEIAVCKTVFDKL